MKKRKRQEQIDNAFVKETAAVHTTFAISTALLKQNGGNWEPSMCRQKLLVVYGFSVLFDGQRSLLWKVKYPWSFLAFLLSFNAFSAGKSCLCF